MDASADASSASGAASVNATSSNRIVKSLFDLLQRARFSLTRLICCEKAIRRCMRVTSSSSCITRSKSQLSRSRSARDGSLFTGAACVEGPAAALGAGEGVAFDGASVGVALTIDARPIATPSNRLVRSLPIAKVRSRAN